MARAEATRRGESSGATASLPIVREPTPREIEVLQLVADGFGSGQIARRLWVSEETVKTHVANVLDKLGAVTRAHAVAVAMRRGLIT